jgi:hypothetical protein
VCFFGKMSANGLQLGEVAEIKDEIFRFALKYN